MLLVRSHIALILLAASVSQPRALAADQAMAFKSVKVDLPFGERTLPDGPGAEVTANNCLACHSAGMILTQPALSAATWQAEVDKMRAVYKAPVADEDVKPIVEYLSRIKGTH